MQYAMNTTDEGPRMMIEVPLDSDAEGTTVIERDYRINSPPDPSPASCGIADRSLPAPAMEMRYFVSIN